MWCKKLRATYKSEQAANATATATPAKKHGRYPRIKKEQISKLENIGFEWDVTAYWWRRKFDKLRAYATEPGCGVNDYFTQMKNQLQTKSVGTHLAQKNVTYGQSLSNWCEKLRAARKNEQIIMNGDVGTKRGNHRISKSQIEMLESINFEWERN